jgi:hypothetical protein
MTPHEYAATVQQSLDAATNVFNAVEGPATDAQGAQTWTFRGGYGCEVQVSVEPSGLVDASWSRYAKPVGHSHAKVDATGAAELGQRIAQFFKGDDTVVKDAV